MPFNWRNPESGLELFFDVGNVAVSLAYDLRNQGIIIALTPRTPGAASATHWWYHLPTQSFWKMAFGTVNVEPFVLHQRVNFVAAAATDSTIMWGGRNGYVYRFANDVNADDGSTFTSYVFFGPFGDPSLFSDMIITELVGVLAKDSGQVKWSIHVGDTPEEAFAAEAREEGLWNAGRNNAHHPRTRGQSQYLKLTSVDATGWGFEAAYAVLQRAGRTRV